ncbi:AbiJ-NTD4 domain-containing protein [Burkholderia ubonensis]|uniref:AbiJ-NTD4 domain-containing protein n=1 Tax=Burkholderia ubonensis TaxID=101571 RepID=UPI001454293E|nr:hypothetical protein [Burkholderia ubonensis]VWB78364.1 hypothetical protein BUB20358_03691 [Burkholderia ubonensis]
MPLKFSQRLGITPLPEAIKPDTMPDELRSSLWNAFLDWQHRQNDETLLNLIWRHFWKRPADTIPIRRGYGGPSFHDAWKLVRDYFFDSDWHGVYDFLEFLIRIGYPGEQLGQAVDKVLARELAAYRIVNSQIVPVTSTQEVQALEQALSDKGPFVAASAHLSTALGHLSNRQNPDYRNSIKESISAVEAVAKVVSGKDKAELGDALATLEKAGKLHAALRKGYSALYGYTSDANGIRHALMDEPNLNAEDAKYFLLACTAFVNYLKTLA